MDNEDLKSCTVWAPKSNYDVINGTREGGLTKK